MPQNFGGDSAGGGSTTTKGAGRPPPPTFSTSSLAPKRTAEDGPARRIAFVPARRREAPSDALAAWRAAADVLVIRADAAASESAGPHQVRTAQPPGVPPSCLPDKLTSCRW